MAKGNYMLNDESLGLVHTYTSYDERVLRVRKVNRLLKDQKCVWCENVIPKGSSAAYISGLSARRFYSYYECEICKGE